MTVRQFLTLLRARWLLALGVLLLALAITAAFTWMLPKQYAATATVLIDVKSPDPIAGMVFPTMGQPSYMATQTDIIESERVGLRVVRNLRMTDSADMRLQWQKATRGAGSFEVWLAELLLKNLDVKPARESNLIQIRFKSVDPRFSAAVANGFAQAYIDTTLELRVDPARQYSSFFDGRAKQLRDEVEKAQDRLSSFQKSSGLLATEERVDIETARLNELSSQLVALQAVSADSRSRQAAARDSADRLQDVINHPVVTGLRGELSRQEARLLEFSARLGDQHPQVLELQAHIGGLRAKIEQETQRLSGSLTVSNDINTARLSLIRAALDAQRARVLRLKEQRDEAAVLLREVEHAQRAYDMVMVRHSQMLLESQNTLTNAAVLVPATEPYRPASPQPLLNLLIGGCAGVFAAIALVLLREATDRRVRSVDDLVRDLGLPVLGSMLGREPRRWFGGRARHLLPPRLLGRASGAQPPSLAA
jgi:succinoglycan biosynthesis transport protein ExoP